MSDFCEHCNASNQVEHDSLWSRSSLRLAVMLRASEFGYRDEVKKITDEWRTHALPVCDPLAIK